MLRLHVVDGLVDGPYLLHKWHWWHVNVGPSFKWNWIGCRWCATTRRWYRPGAIRAGIRLVAAAPSWCWRRATESTWSCRKDRCTKEIIPRGPATLRSVVSGFAECPRYDVIVSSWLSRLTHGCPIFFIMQITIRRDRVCVNTYVVQ